MKFGITNDDVINIQAYSKHLRINEQLKSLERGKREIPIKRLLIGVVDIREHSKFLNSRESRGIVPKKPLIQVEG